MGASSDVHSWRDSFASGRALSFTGTVNSAYRESSLEVFDLVYGPGSLSDSRSYVTSTLERLYEPHASTWSQATAYIKTVSTEIIAQYMKILSLRLRLVR
jgi:hypothetical protein